MLYCHNSLLNQLDPYPATRFFLSGCLALEGVLLPEHMLFPLFSIDLHNIQECDVSMDWLTISIIVMIM